MNFEIFIGWDPRDRLAWQVAVASLQRHAREPLRVTPIWRQSLELDGYYRRPTETRRGALWDVISGEPCSTEFSIARFGVGFLATAQWALFVDADFLFRADPWELYDARDSRFAVQVVKHKHTPKERVKMDGQAQRAYRRKNWSSCVLWNLFAAGRTANERELFHRFNTWHRDRLHAFDWLKDEEIGELPGGEAWNWLDGHSDPEIEPKAVHFTRGTPDMPGWEHTRYAKEWNRYAEPLLTGRHA